MIGSRPVLRSLSAGVWALLCLGAPALAQEPDSAARPAYKPQKLTPAPGASSLKVVDLGQGVSVTQRGRGKLLVVSDQWDFGFVPQDAQVTHRYVLQNSGDDTLFIEEVKPTCGCTVASLAKNRLAPGEKVPVDVTLSTKKFSGLLAKKVHVISSDAESSRYELGFKADVGAAPSSVGWASGTAVDFDRNPTGAHQSRRLPFTNHSASAVSVKIAETPVEYVKASLTSARLAPNESAELVIEILGAPPQGPFHGSVTLDLEGAQNTRVTVPITVLGATN